MTDRSPITIDDLLKRINLKLAPHGRIHKAAPHEYSGGLGIWFVTENTVVSQTFDDVADFHQYAGDLGVLHDVAHVNFPEGYFPEGSGFEGVTASLYDDNGKPSLGLMWVGPAADLGDQIATDTPVLGLPDDAKQEINITGRDDYIVSQALVYAMAQIQSLPPGKQERSNMCDMARLVRRITTPDWLVLIADGVRHHTGVDVEMWPGARTSEDEQERDAFTKRLAGFASQRGDLHI